MRLLIDQNRGCERNKGDQKQRRKKLFKEEKHIRFLKVSTAHPEGQSHRIQYIKVIAHDSEGSWSRSELVRRLTHTAKIHEGLPYVDDPEINKSDSRKLPVKRKRALNSTHGRPSKGDKTSCKVDKIMLHCASDSNPQSIHAGRKLSSRVKSRKPVLNLK